MANVDFFAFPSFSAVTRYEHSLGVCYLSRIAAESLGLETKDKYELMIAALYHDVTTPPFAHATEEFLKDRFNFDHERRFLELLTGRSSDIGGSYSQVFEGRALKLPQYAKGTVFRKHRMNLFRIPKLVFGDRDDPHANLISGDIDLDNIDNVVRAAAAMGILESHGELAETLARSFVWTVDGKIGMSAHAEPAVRKWMWLRSHLYDMILCSVDDFALQTMLKYCLRLLADSDDPDLALSEEDWKLTEPEIMNRMNELPECRQVLKRMRLKHLFPCLGLLWLSGEQVVSYTASGANISQLEYFGRMSLKSSVICNFYLDKRHRSLDRKLVFSDGGFSFSQETSGENGVLLGFFAADPVSEVVEDNGEKYLKPLREKAKQFLCEVAAMIPGDIRVNRVRLTTEDGYPHLKKGEQVQ